MRGGRRAALAVLLPWLPTAEELKRLTIVNGCNTEPIWIAHLANTGVGPGAQNSKIEPGASFSFGPDVTDGLEGARYWPKMGCDENGDHCSLGGSGGPSQACVINGDDYSNCAPPVDTKFEATWGREGEPCDASNPATMAGCDSVDVSLVDGWTLPFKLEVKSGVCTAAGEKTVSQIDCSGLTLDQCPANEDFGGGNGAVSMQAVNPSSGQQAGCYGPCLKLIDDKWGNAFATGRSREDPDVVPYCCTTPPMDSETCNAGPIKDSKYLDTVHRLCPGVYGFAYDDGMGLLRCTYGEYVVTFFCPGAGAVHAAPAQPPLPPAGAGGAAAAAPPAAGVPPGQGNCKDAVPGEPCFKAVRWAIEHGFAEHPEWYPRLSASSPEAAFQARLAELGEGGCARPCAEPAGGPDPGSVGAAVPPASEAAAPPAAAADGAIRRFTPRGALHNAGVREGSGPGAPAALAVAVAAVASSLLALRRRGHRPAALRHALPSRTGTLLEPDQGAYALTAQDL